MATTHTIPFKTLDSLTLYLEIFTYSPTSTSPYASLPFNPLTATVLLLHGGGFVAFNREHVPVHVVQSCLIRGWNLVSADYRLLPQVTGKQAMEDISDAYVFVREKLGGLLKWLKGEKGEGEERIENIMIVGQSAGAYYTHLLSPPPIAILTYHGFATLSSPTFSKPSIARSSPIRLSEISHYLSEPPHANLTPSFNIFNPSSLRNPDYALPEVNLDNEADIRIDVLRWLIQEDGLLPKWFDGVEPEGGLESKVWKRDGFPEVMVHGTEDTTVPFEGSKQLLDVFVPKPKLFVAEGKGHSFDQFLFLGEEGLKVVEEAWNALEEIVEREAW